MTKAQVKGKTGSDEQKAFKDGVLLYVDMQMWGATAKIDKRTLLKLGLSEEDLEVMSAVRDLLTPEGKSLLGDYRTVRNEVKGHIYRNSIPFPIDGFVFIPKHKVAEIDDFLKKKKDQADTIRDQLIEKIADLEQEYAKQYPQFYDPAKYPSKAQLKGRFQFRWSFRMFSPPDQELQLLPPEIYKEEVNRFKEDMEKTKQMTLNLFVNSLVERANTLFQQCESDSAKTATIESTMRLMDRFDDLFSGFIEEKKVRKAVDDVKLYLEGVDQSMLNIDNEFRAIVGDKMRDIVNTVKTVPGVTLKRGLEL